MKIIHCNLWGDIEISDLAISIIDTPHFQRLHYIKQTGMSYKVFPGAHTSRFEHSIGVYGVIRTLIDHLIKKQPDLVESCNERKQELICIAGLIHDLGHGPFSHLFDYYLEKSGIHNGWQDHETRSLDLLTDIVTHHKVQISEHEIEFIQGLVQGQSAEPAWYDTIVNNKIAGLDMDKMDYVLRDSMNFGMKIHFDPLRIIKNCRVIDGELCFCDRIKDEIITVFLIRNKMNRFIYRHPKVCEYESIIMDYLESPVFGEIKMTMSEKNIEKFLALNDYTLLFKIPRDEYQQYECRKKKYQKEHKEYKDEEWSKIVNLQFYQKKDTSRKFSIENWNIVSCYS